MADVRTQPEHEVESMHEVYRQGGAARSMAPHVIYSDPACPHPDCGERLQAIDFRLEVYGPGVHDALVRAWWSDDGFVGRCPKCNRWIHFTIRSKEAVTDDQAAGLLKLPESWWQTALIL